MWVHIEEKVIEYLQPEKVNYCIKVVLTKQPNKADQVEDSSLNALCTLTPSG